LPLAINNFYSYFANVKKITKYLTFIEGNLKLGNSDIKISTSNPKIHLARKTKAIFFDTRYSILDTRFVLVQNEMDFCLI